MVPVIASQVITAAALGGIIWNRLSGVERRIGDLSDHVDRQNGRIGKLEEWKARREGFQSGWDERGEQGGREK